VASSAVAVAPALDAFCMNCFALMAIGNEVCSSCGASVTALSGRDFHDKLLRALNHPLGEVRARAIVALGMRGDDDAADALVNCALRHESDTVEGLNVVRSLRGIRGGWRSLVALHQIRSEHPAVAVREAARAAIVHRNLGGG